MTQPYVSVVMPVYNGERFLAEAIDSILSQTFTDFEFLIVDDGSTDSTPAILKRYATLDGRIRVLRQFPNQGIVVALNMGIAQAKGDLIAIMHSDDISLPERFQRQTSYLDATPDVGVLGTAILHIDAAGKRIPGGYSYPLSSPGLVGWTNLFMCSLAHPTIMMRRPLFERVGGYRQDAYSAEDFDLWTRLSQVTLLDNIPEPLLKYRTWSGTITSSHSVQMEEIAIQCVQQGVSNLIGETISIDEAAFLRYLTFINQGKPPRTLADIKSTGKLLQVIFDTYLHQKRLDEVEKRAISQSAALKFLRLALLALQHSVIYTLFLLKHAFLLNPLAYLQAIYNQWCKLKSS